MILVSVVPHLVSDPGLGPSGVPGQKRVFKEFDLHCERTNCKHIAQSAHTQTVVLSLLFCAP